MGGLIESLADVGEPESQLALAPLELDVVRQERSLLSGLTPALLLEAASDPVPDGVVVLQLAPALGRETPGERRTGA